MMRQAVAIVLSVISGGTITLLAQARPAAPPASAPKPPAPSAQAQTAAKAPGPVAFPADARVALVDMSAVLAQSSMGNTSQAALKAAGDRWSATLQALGNRMQTLQQELQTQQATLSSSAFAAKKAEGDKMQLELQYQQRQRDAEMQQLSQRLSDEFDAKVLPIIADIRKERNLWMVFEVGETSVAASHPGIDISSEVVQRVNAAK
ncbi:MAG: OmpH family outer membrane protein [Vicinamibacterales bacterium]